MKVKRHLCNLQDSSCAKRRRPLKSMVKAVGAAKDLMDDAVVAS